MKQTLLLSVFIACICNIYAQDSIHIKKVPSYGCSFVLKDFPTAATIFSLNKHGWNNYLAPGLNGLFITGLSNHFDFISTIGIYNTRYKKNDGSFYYHNADNYNIGKKKVLVDLNTLVNYKLITDKHTLVPYIAFGLGISLYNGSYFLPYTPLGGGLQYKLGNNRFLYLQTLLDLGILTTKSQDATKENLNYSLGISFPLHPVHKKAIITTIHPPVEVELDTDGDGVPDKKDFCPTIPGLAKYNGCPMPDTDHDGINDEEDSCPSIAGIAKYHGCPIPDTDHDGINDEEDSCPTITGIAKYHGCPIPDRDSDGVNDEIDSCPHEAGTIQNNGCPNLQDKMSELARFIYFNVGSSVVDPNVHSILDQVVVIMLRYPNCNLEIQGHTDNKGNPISNKKISKARADTIKRYLISKGIPASRLNAVGYGMERPIALNKTETGRSLNRRVELHAVY